MRAEALSSSFIHLIHRTATLILLPLLQKRELQKNIATEASRQAQLVTTLTQGRTSSLAKDLVKLGNQKAQDKDADEDLGVTSIDRAQLPPVSYILHMRCYFRGLLLLTAFSLHDFLAQPFFP
jgi:hypothetical protein